MRDMRTNIFERRVGAGGGAPLISMLSHIYLDAVPPVNIGHSNKPLACPTVLGDVEQSTPEAQKLGVDAELAAQTEDDVSEPYSGQESEIAKSKGDETTAVKSGTSIDSADTDSLHNENSERMSKVLAHADVCTQCETTVDDRLAAVHHDMNGWAQTELVKDLRELHALLEELRKMEPPITQENTLGTNIMVQTNVQKVNRSAPSRSLSRPVIVHVVNQTPQEPVPYPKPLRQLATLQNTPRGRRSSHRSPSLYQSIDSRTGYTWSTPSLRAQSRGSFIDETVE